MLGLERDLSDFYRLARGDTRLRELADRLRGMKPVRYATVFEAFANAVAGQLVSLSAGMHVLNRIARGVRKPAGSACDAMRSFPTAAAIARSNPEALRALGLSRQKGEYLIGLARLAIDPKDRDFASIAALGDMRRNQTPVEDSRRRPLDGRIRDAARLRPDQHFPRRRRRRPQQTFRVAQQYVDATK